MLTTDSADQSAPDRYAVLGNPIAHSKSPELQMAFARQTGENITYRAICVEPDHFATTVTDFFSTGGKGLNITLPFKQEACQLADRLTSRARRAGAVNTLYLEAGQLVGDNTDGVGLVSDLREHLHWPLRDKHIVILGAGGAVRGVLEPLINEAPATLTIANRTLSKAESLARDFADRFTIHTCRFQELTGPVDMIINATSTGLTGDLPPVATTLISGATCCYDMLYEQKLTPFLQWARAAGANAVSDGLGMLVCQGAASFSIWRGCKPDTFEVLRGVRGVD